MGRGSPPTDGSPFALPSAPEAPGVLCIHGFTGTPFEMHHVGKRLHERGFAVWSPALPGHNSNLDDLDATTWRDWYAAIEDTFDRLRRTCGPVAVVGQSLGGLLALYLAAQRGADMAAVAALATPLWLPRLARIAVQATAPSRRLHRWVRRLPKLGGPDVRDRDMKRRNPCYPAIPTKALQQLVEFIDVVGCCLHLVHVPTLVVHARRDHTAPYASSERIAATVAADVVRHCALEQSYHLIAIDVERDLVAAEVGDFIVDQLGAARTDPEAAMPPTGAFREE